MPSTPHTLISSLRSMMIGAWRNDPRSDTDLLNKYSETRDEIAFAALMWRHGPLVWRTCKQILGDTPDAEDAFQSTFLALSRKASRLRRGPLAGWLHRVARQAALDVRVGARQRQNLEQKLRSAAEPEVEEARDIGKTELYATLDKELADLPEKLRVPLLMHYMEGKSQAELAKILGCARSTLQERLEKGEALLRKRLERRGVTLGLTSMTALLGSTAGAPSVPARLIENTAQAAVAFRAGTFTGVTAEAAEKLARSLSLKNVLWKNWWVVLTVAGFFGIGGVGLIAWRMAATRSGTVEAPSKLVAIPASPAPVSSFPRVDIYGDPLPKDALVRIGTVRFRGTGADWQWGMEGDDVWRFKVALSPDGKTLASSHTHNGITRHSNKHIRFWDFATGKQLHETVLKGMGSSFHIAFSTDGKLLAVANEREIWLLDAVTGQPSERTLPGSWPLAFTPDGKILVCKTEGPSFTFYDVVTGKTVRTITVENLTPINIGAPWRGVRWPNFAFARFSRDGQSLAYIEESRLVQGIVHLLDVKTGNELATLKGQQVRALAFMPDGSKLVTAGKDKVIRIWDAKTGKELRQLGTMTEVASLVDFLADGKTVLAACTGQIRCWDIATGKEARPALDCKGLLCPQILSADGTKLIERVQDSLSIWDVATGKEIGPAAGAPRFCMDNLAFSPDGKTLATQSPMGVSLSSGKSEFQLWEVATGKPFGSFAVSDSAPGFRGWEMAWPSSRSMLIMARTFPNFPKSRMEWIHMNIAPRSMIIQLKKESAEGSIVKTQMFPDGLKFSPDGQVFARWRGQDIEILEVATGKKLAAVPFRTRNPVVDSDLIFSADHQLLATHSLLDPTITLWEVCTGRKLYSFNIPPSSVDDPRYDILIGFSPDSRLVVTQDWKTKVVSLWEHVSGRLRLRLPTPPEYFNDDNNMVFSPDGRLLAMGYVSGSKEERSVYVWDLATGQECQRLQGHQAGGRGAPQIVFSPNGQHLASAGMDYTVLIWDVKLPSALKGPSQPLDQQEMQTLKTALYGADAAAAYRAICRLRQAPEQAVPLAAECLRPDTHSLESERVAQETGHLIDDLDSNDFQTRAKAEEKLRKNLHREENELIIETILRQALEKKPDVGVSKTIAQLLNELAEERKWGGALSPELTRMFRGIEVLESIHNNAACEVLQKMVQVPPRPEVRREAEAALKRLAAPLSASARP